MEILYLDEIDSTNTYAKKNIDNLADKIVISANVQTKGHGRFQRSWVDLGRENIYMTFVLKPSDKVENVYANLTQYLSVCLCKQFERFNLYPQIKWPNDILVNGKKVCGILAETVIKGENLKGIALGIGINLNASIEDLNRIDCPVTSLNIELGKSVDKKEFMQNLIEDFFVNYEDFLKKGFLLIKEDYEKNSILTRKENLKIAVFNKIKNGIFEGFDNNGNLLLQNAESVIEKINMGEIT